MTDRPWPDNDLSVSLIAGEPVSFVVIGDCICCSVCSDIAPDNFRLSDDEDHNICHQQPRDDDELAACCEAAESCPVEVIVQRGAG